MSDASHAQLQADIIRAYGLVGVDESCAVHLPRAIQAWALNDDQTAESLLSMFYACVEHDVNFDPPEVTVFGNDDDEPAAEDPEVPWTPTTTTAPPSGGKVALGLLGVGLLGVAAWGAVKLLGKRR